MRMFKTQVFHHNFLMRSLQPYIWRHITQVATRIIFISKTVIHTSRWTRDQVCLIRTVRSLHQTHLNHCPSASLQCLTVASKKIFCVIVTSYFHLHGFIFNLILKLFLRYVLVFLQQRLIQKQLWRCVTREVLVSYCLFFDLQCLPLFWERKDNLKFCSLILTFPWCTVWAINTLSLVHTHRK